MRYQLNYALAVEILVCINVLWRHDHSQNWIKFDRNDHDVMIILKIE